MTTTTKSANPAVRAVLTRQGDLITRSQALACAMTKSELRSKVRAGGRWQVVLPGIYLAHVGLLTAGQREIAATLYAGRGCVITGMAALRWHGVRVPIEDRVDVLIPATSRRQSLEFVQVHRTERMPERVWLVDGLRWAPVARAACDAVRGQGDLKFTRALVADVVQQGKCSVEQLTAELRAGPSRGSGTLREALADVAAGARSIAEGDLRRLIKVGGLPEPLYNVSLYAGSSFLAKADAWWSDCGVAAEVDSREWHIKPADWERTLARHGRMSAHGIIVIHLTPRRIRAEPDGVVAELRAALESGRQRPPLSIEAFMDR